MGMFLSLFALAGITGCKKERQFRKEGEGKLKKRQGRRGRGTAAGETFSMISHRGMSFLGKNRKIAEKDTRVKAQEEEGCRDFPVSLAS